MIVFSIKNPKSVGCLAAKDRFSFWVIIDSIIFYKPQIRDIATKHVKIHKTILVDSTVAFTMFIGSVASTRLG